VVSLKNLNLNSVVFIDIETVGLQKELEKDSPLYKSWEYKTKKGSEIFEEKELNCLYKETAPLYAEFGKIVCITIGKVSDGWLKLKTYANDNEHTVLTEFTTALNKIYAADKKTVLCGHAIKGFDIPFIMRRCLINQIPLPALIDVGHLKPWEQTSVDTFELWKAGGFNGASLIAIAVALGLPSPKEDMAGYEVNEIYYNEPNALSQIIKYCERDVKTVANIVLRCRYEPIIEEISQIEIKPVGLLQKINSARKIEKADEPTLLSNLEKLNEIERVIADKILNVALPKTKKKVNESTNKG